jgi:hypothetical protein
MNPTPHLHPEVHTAMHLLKTFAALLLALALLPGCGGGEEDEALYAQDVAMGHEEPPSRGPEWLLPPPEELLVAE